MASTEQSSLSTHAINVNPGRVPKPSRDGLDRAKLALHPRDHFVNPGRVPKPSRDGLDRAKLALHPCDQCEPWEGSQTLPRWPRPSKARSPPTRPLCEP